MKDWEKGLIDFLNELKNFLTFPKLKIKGSFFSSRILQGKTCVRINYRIIRKNYPVDLEKGCLLKTILKSYRCTPAMPTTWKLISKNSLSGLLETCPKNHFWFCLLWLWVKDCFLNFYMLNIPNPGVPKIFLFRVQFFIRIIASSKRHLGKFLDIIT